MPRLAESDAVAGRPQVLALCEHVPPPVFGGCWPLPYVRRHAVKNLHWVRTCRRHRLRVTVVEGIDVLEHRGHWIVGARHNQVVPSLLVLIALSRARHT